MLKLPKSLMDDPRLGELEERFMATGAPLREGGSVTVSRWAFDERLKTALRVAQGTGHLMQGLELIVETLDREQKGLKAVQEKTNQPPGQRLSRLLLLAKDGSDRFYRQAESLLLRNADRAWCCLVDATAAELGAACTRKGSLAKAVLIGDKDALVLFLRALHGP